MKKYSQEVLDVAKRLPNYIKFMYKILKNNSLKRGHRMMIYGAVGYILSPIDLIPGIIPVLGQLDDLLVVLTIIYNVIKSYREGKFAGILEECSLTKEIIERDIRSIKNYTKLIGISTAKVIAQGVKVAAGKGLKIMKKIKKDKYASIQV